MGMKVSCGKKFLLVEGEEAPFIDDRDYARSILISSGFSPFEPVERRILTFCIPSMCLSYPSVS
jgi:hypothetical protein